MLGGHRVVCGDCTTVEAVDAATQGQRVALCLTDPPYSVAYEQQEREPGRQTRQDKGDAYADPKDAGVLLREFISLLPTDFLVMTYAFNRHFHELAEATAGWDMLYECVWVKQHFAFVIGRRYQPKHEPILFFRRNGGKAIFNVPPEQSTVFEYDRAAANPDHPTPKPLAMWEALLGYHSEVGSAVYDPFLGSGTTLIAAEKLGRVCYGIEVEPRYVDVTCRRWAQMTGQTPTLEGTGQAFVLD